MAKNIEPTLKLISQYLKLDKNQNFVIPEYQRGYSWDISQCDKLWQDIESFISSNASDPYFFGTIIVDCSNSHKFSLIDGQQRTTTFLLLLKALLIRINDVLKVMPNDEDSEALIAGLKANRNRIMAILYKAEDEEIPSMLKDSKNTQNILILENKSINELYSKEAKQIIESLDFATAEQNVFKIPRKQKDNKYTNYFRNFKFFYNNLKNKSDSQLNQFAKVFLEKCQVIEIRSWQVEQAITMFNSLNSTGMPLSDADIISAQLYSNSGDEKVKFNEQWESINKFANELSVRKVVNIDGVLQQYMYIFRAINKEYINKKEDDTESVDVTTPGLRKFYTDNDDFGINSPRRLLDSPLELCSNLTKIINIWNKTKDYPIVKLLMKFNENAKLFLSSYLYRFEINEIDEKKTLDICECLLRLFTILELSDVGFSSNKFKTFLFGENIKLVEKNISIEIIKKDFDEHISNNWSEEVLSQAISEYDKNILVFLNEYIYSKNKGNKFDFADSVNIEHIMPSSGRNINIIQQDAGIVDRDEFNSFVNKIGNKILLEDDINKSISNEWFKTKKQNSINSKTGYKDSRYPLAYAITNYHKDTWEKNDIELATKKATERIINFTFNK